MARHTTGCAYLSQVDTHLGQFRISFVHFTTGYKPAFTSAFTLSHYKELASATRGGVM
jgi:hypothetical protein